jgi:transcriptional regulator with XRE-family HTH domain
VSTWEAYHAELTELLKGFGENVRRLRERREEETGERYAQEALAADANLHRTQIGNIERGKTDPRLSTLLALADGFGVTLDALAEGLPAPRERRPAPGTRD